MSHFEDSSTSNGHVTGMLYGRVGERIIGAISVKLPKSPAWDALDKGEYGSELTIKTSADHIPDVAINLLDKAGKSDITNSFRIVSFSGTPTKPGTVQVDVFVGGVQVPMSFEVYVREEA